MINPVAHRCRGGLDVCMCNNCVLAAPVPECGNVRAAHYTECSCVLTLNGFTARDPDVLTLIGLTAQDFLG